MFRYENHVRAQVMTDRGFHLHPTHGPCVTFRKTTILFFRHVPNHRIIELRNGKRRNPFRSYAPFLFSCYDTVRTCAASLSRSPAPNLKLARNATEMELK